MESPDVEKDFPGLYEERSNDSDYSEEGAKNQLLVGKRKDKKKDKEKGYAALEGESSGGEDSKSPSKAKKAKSFKFTSSKREKKDKKEKELKEKDSKDNEKQEKKDKKEKESKKLKPKDKDKKKSKHKDELNEELPLFGVSLSVAVERQPCKDGVQIPLVVRECIDYIEETGLALEGIYRTNVVKTKLQQLRQKYDRREVVDLYNYDPHTAANLLKLYIRDLPEPILSGKYLSALEECSTGDKKIEDVALLFNQLPNCNRSLLSWLFTHFEHVLQREKQNKISIKEMILMLAPTLQLSSKVLQALLTHHDMLFGRIRLTRHSLPTVDVATGLTLPQTAEDLFLELSKREAILEHLHAEMRQGVSSAKQDEYLWETQRLVTLLKRRLRQFQKKDLPKSRSDSAAEEDKLDLSVKQVGEEVQQKQTTETQKPAKEPQKQAAELQKPPTESQKQPLETQKQPTEPINQPTESQKQIIEPQAEPQHSEPSHTENKRVDTAEDVEERRGSYVTVVSIDSEQEAQREELALLLLEEAEILLQQSKLRSHIQRERAEVEALKQEIANKVKELNLGDEAKSRCNVTQEEAQEITQAEGDNKRLEAFNNELLDRIVGEQLACARLQAHMELIKLKQQLGMIS